MASELHCTNLVLYGQITMREKWSVPLGHIYFQLPGESDPDDLYYGTWENISATYAGDFFRAEGGDANVFEAGEQSDAIRNITGSFGRAYGANVGHTETGPFQDIPSTGTSRGKASGLANSPADFDVSRAVPTASENRPVNHTMRVWKRTA